MAGLRRATTFPGARRAQQEGGGADDTKNKISFRGVWREARELVWESRHRLAIGLVLILINRLASFVLPSSSKILIDEVIGNDRADLLVPLSVAAFLATAIQAATTFGLAIVLSITAQRAITEMRKKVQKHVMRLPVGFFDSTKSGALISRIITDPEGIRNLVGTGMVQMIGGMITASIALTVLFWLNWQLTVITLLVLISFGIGMAMAFSRVRPLFRERGELNARLSGRLAEALGGVRVVKSYTAERHEDLVFAKGAHRLFRNVAKTLTATSAVTATASVIFGTIGAVMLLIGGRAILAGSMTLGDLVMYIFFTGMVAAPMIQISNIGTQISEAFAGLDRIRELRRLATEADEDRDKEALPTVRGDIELRDVEFEYEEDVPVLRGVSFSAPAGTTTALVGSSGSGKSTILGLLMGFYRPQAGQVFIDGHELTSVAMADYRAQLGIVLQENFLFDGTVAENIGYSNPKATRETIVEAAKIANCHGFIEELPESYDTVVGERGVKLSGGQRQRVAIARAILANPSILVLDEATSSLDSESEALIQEGLANLRQGRTTFVIAHRLSTIQSADQILVVEEGQIVERGSHQELLELDGRYRELYDKQYKFERNRFINPGEDFTPTPQRPEAPAPRRRRQSSL
ncbi:MAG: ABC transporter ATP-binding protein [Acidobacteriota bacterium]